MRISIITQDTLLRDGLQSLLWDTPGVSVAPGDGSVESAAKLIETKGTDLIVVPAEGLTSHEVQSLLHLKQRHPVTVLALSRDGSVPRELAPIADRIVSRSAGAEGLRRALGARPASVTRETGTTYRSRTRLTPREEQVAQLIARGMSNRRISLIIGIQEQSVKNLVSVVMRKLQCENRTQVALQLMKHSAFTSKT
ncbi:MAG: LuxR C-terminal-related transcriptional regulator [Fimbriimonadaceae bacterium]|uniref:DNA-binding response regulator NarL/FixJ family containing REC and HTH domains n=1 Tax=Candidatus Nitrosymbiomonas proteolyticus TaxID=2608984 RepID=A0A809R652_9BACT|nr:MAG: DNA-binding response regulator [Armatimonadota bacterium]MBV6490321.1 hypothetical protein [Fimbriimonadaceae bacterium]QOJ11318.1 MAG: response regulator transcription factor [Chthonomonadaceae bacterium]BBO23053.1 DNA-binding response regulator NarL/FixJ family containing REC and HTH domains [Candidatus Nitrosymbiomonas proteolyticus]MCL4283570.1 hypothetical protein [Fimbriimonadaceae bacterium]